VESGQYRMHAMAARGGEWWGVSGQWVERGLRGREAAPMGRLVAPGQMPTYAGPTQAWPRRGAEPTANAGTAKARG
jgi:hypothetical protein